MNGILVTGGVRSGKSRHAERLLGSYPEVTYLATGPAPEADDADWAARVAAHRARRPATWRTVETLDLAEQLRVATGPVLVDCLGTWLTGVIDAAGLWDEPVEVVEAAVTEQLDAVVAALGATTQPSVLVTNEVGLGVVPEHRSGRLFRDLLGLVNLRVAEVCDEVHLIVAGKLLTLR